MKKSVFQALSILLCISQAGCASVISGRSQDISIRSNPPGAQVFIDEMNMGNTPMIANLKRKKHHSIKFLKSGYAEEIRTTGRGFNWWFVGNILLGGIIGIIVDFGTGAVYNVTPEEVNITLGENKEVAPPVSAKISKPESVETPVLLSPAPSEPKVTD